MTTPGGRPPGPLPLPLAVLFLALFDFFAMGIAAPVAQRDLTGGGSGAELILAAFSVPYAAGLLAGGVIGDRYGPRRMLAAGVCGYVAACLACAAAPVLPALLAARFAQGLAAAVMVPQAFTMVAAFPGRERHRAFAMLGATLGAGSVGGQLLGGLLVAALPAGLGWRAPFGVELLLGSAVLALIRRWPPDRSAGRPRVDGAGLLLTVGALAAVLGPVTIERAAGWSPPVLLSLLAAPVLVVALAVRRHREHRPAPTFADRRAVLAVAATGAVYAVQAALLLALSVRLQDDRHASAAAAGLTLAAYGAGFALTSLAGRALPRAVWWAGPVLALAGIALLTAGGGYAVPLALCGAGVGLLLPPLTAVALGGALPGAVARAAGVLATAQQSAVTLAVTGAGMLIRGGSPATSVREVALLCGGLMAAATALARAANGRRPAA
ncbi:MFS transporter [Dactylosporangium sp. CA-092794]|uniref:MFS transporter n=1 Tax=Dactylosporangium sp. CA-092794 TaxID=3239929 RepID=UPI003D8EAFA0